MTLYEALKKATPDQMALLLLYFTKGLLDIEDKTELRDYYKMFREAMNEEVENI